MLESRGEVVSCLPACLSPVGAGSACPAESAPNQCLVNHWGCTTFLNLV